MSSKCIELQYNGDFLNINIDTPSDIIDNITFEKLSQREVAYFGGVPYKYSGKSHLSNIFIEKFKGIIIYANAINNETKAISPEAHLAKCNFGLLVL